MLCRVPSPYFAHVKVCSSEMKVIYLGERARQGSSKVCKVPPDVSSLCVLHYLLFWIILSRD